MKKLNLNKEKLNKIGKGIKILSFIVMIVLIYIVSPRITQVIRDMAKFIYEIDENYITRVVELILSVSLVASAYIVKKK